MWEMGEEMFRVFRSEHYEKKLFKLDKSEQDRVMKFEQSLKVEPYSGKPLRYKFLEKRNLTGKEFCF